MDSTPFAGEERPVVRCAHCALVQFVTSDGNCRRCRRPAQPSTEPPSSPAAVPEATAIMGVRNPHAIDAAWALRTWRHVMGLSQRQLGVRVGMVRTYICRIETGRAAPSALQILRLCGGLGITVADFLTLAMLDRREEGLD
jgi:DNA-binding XRE family transcriptional regulator